MERHTLSRRSLLRAGSAAAAGLALGHWSMAPGAVARALDDAVQLKADQALDLLIEGNRRWAAGQASHPNQGSDRRAQTALGQQPFAMIFSCVDSRVPPELVFDRGIGDLFVIRTAGHVIDNAALGSIEFGAEELHIPLIVVLGHERCGAVSATVDATAPGMSAEAPGQIGTLVEAIRPAVEQARDRPGDVLDNAVRANVELTVAALRARSSVLEEAAHHGLMIVGARYDLDTGGVEITVR